MINKYSFLGILHSLTAIVFGVFISFISSLTLEIAIMVSFLVFIGNMVFFMCVFNVRITADLNTKNGNT